MLRRFLTSLLIASYAASQLSAWPHAHASQPAGHGERPHVHADWFMRLMGGDAHSLAHRHHTNGDHQHHGHGHSHGKPQPVPTPAVPVEQGHDDNCVYLPYALVAAMEVRMADVAGQFSQPVASCLAAADSGSPALLSLPQRTALHKSNVEHCALYLTLRTLRI